MTLLWLNFQHSTFLRENTQNCVFYRISDASKELDYRA